MLPIKSKYILKNIFRITPQKICLRIIKYNKKIQQKIYINLSEYKKYNQIELEIIPKKN